MRLEYIFGIATGGELESFDKKNRLAFMTNLDQSLMKGLESAVGSLLGGNILMFDVQKRAISNYQDDVYQIPLIYNYSKIYDAILGAKNKDAKVFTIDGLLLYSPAEKYFSDRERLRDYLRLVEDTIKEYDISIVVLDPYVAKKFAFYMKSKYPAHELYFCTNQVSDNKSSEYNKNLDKWRIFCENYDLFGDFVETFAGLKENIFAEDANIQIPMNEYKEFVLNKK